MFEGWYETLNWLLGLDQQWLELSHMILRALIVYALGIVLIRFDKRFIGERTAFDTILRFLIGSALANGITGNSSYFPTVGMALFLVFLNRFIAWLSFYSKAAEKIVKGSNDILYKNNDIQWPAMQRNLITEDDLLSDVRKNAGLSELKQVKEVIFENSGDISIIPKASQRTSNHRRNQEDEGE